MFGMREASESCYIKGKLIETYIYIYQSVRGALKGLGLQQQARELASACKVDQENLVLDRDGALNYSVVENAMKREVNH